MVELFGNYSLEQILRKVGLAITGKFVLNNNIYKSIIELEESIIIDADILVCGSASSKTLLTRYFRLFQRFG